MLIVRWGEKRFINTLRYAAENSDDGGCRTAATAMCFSFLLVPAVPVTLDAVQPPIWAEKIFVVFHYVVLSAFTIATAAAAVPPSRQMMRVKCPPHAPSWVAWHRLIGWPVKNRRLVQGSFPLFALQPLRRGGEGRGE
ncbi:hypothetical protein LY78DRAFT_678611 [Colletotrichum sublineola]|nr:hypothetical protein LY78DRAFT_678611 [Colletotrichum sublineola]